MPQKKAIFTTTTLVAAITATGALCAASLIGLLATGAAYPDPAFQDILRPNDAANLITVGPLLAVALILAGRRSPASRALLPGGLLAAVYGLLPPILIGGFGWLYLLRLLTLALAIAVAGATLHQSARSASAHPTSAQTPRWPAWILVLLAVAIVGHQGALTAAAIAGSRALLPAEQASLVADCLVFLPGLPAAAVLVWRRRPSAPILGGSLLAAYGTLSLGLVPYLGLQAELRGAAADPGAIITVVAISGLCIAGLFGLIRPAIGRNILANRP